MKISLCVRCLLFALPVMLICVVLIPQVNAQSSFYDDFEDGDVNGWSLVFGEGSIWAVQDTVCSGAYAMRVFSTTAGLTTVQRDNFSAFGGTYQACFYSVSVDVAFLQFQYQDEDNHYGVIILSKVGTIGLFKRIGGVLTEIYDETGLMPSDQANVRVVREEDGQLELYYNDGLLFSGNDQSIMTDGGFCVSAEYRLFADNVSFQKNGDRPILAPSTSPYGLVILALLLAGTALWLVYRRRVGAA